MDKLFILAAIIALCTEYTVAKSIQFTDGHIIEVIDCISTSHNIWEQQPHAANCQWFVSCMNNIGIVQQCPGELYFNSETLVCDDPENTSCVGGTTTTESTTTSTVAVETTTADDTTTTSTIGDETSVDDSTTEISTTEVASTVETTTSDEETTTENVTSETTTNEEQTTDITLEETTTESGTSETTTSEEQSTDITTSPEETTTENGTTETTTSEELTTDITTPDETTIENVTPETTTSEEQTTDITTSTDETTTENGTQDTTTSEELSTSDETTIEDQTPETTSEELTTDITTTSSTPPEETTEENVPSETTTDQQATTDTDSGETTQGDATVTTELPTEHCEPLCANLPEEGGELPDPTNCNRFMSCVDRCRGAKHFCPANLHFNQLLSVCDLPSRAECTLEVCNGWENGFLPSVNSCRHLYACVDSNALLEQCGTGLVFDPVKIACVAEDETNGCQVKEIPEAPEEIKELCEPSVVEQLLRHPKYCDVYYRCVRGSLSSRRCGEGLHFDELSGACNLRELAGCVV